MKLQAAVCGFFVFKEGIARGLSPYASMSEAPESEGWGCLEAKALARYPILSR